MLRLYILPHKMSNQKQKILSVGSRRSEFQRQTWRGVNMHCLFA